MLGLLWSAFAVRQCWNARDSAQRLMPSGALRGVWTFGFTQVCLGYFQPGQREEFFRYQWPECYHPRGRVSGAQSVINAIRRWEARQVGMGD